MTTCLWGRCRGTEGPGHACEELLLLSTALQLQTGSVYFFLIL